MIANSLYCLIEDKFCDFPETLRNAYKAYCPTDKAMFERLDPKTTLADLWRVFINGGEDDFYALCNDDSMVREAVFNAFTFFTKLPYDFFYYLWLRDEKKAFETLYSDNSIGKFREVADEETLNTDD